MDLSVVLSHTLRTLGIENRETLVAMLQFDLQSVIELLNDDAMLLAAQARAEVALADAARESDAALEAARMDARNHAVAAMEVNTVTRQCVSSAMEQAVMRATRRDVACTATFSAYLPFPRMVSAATQCSVAMKSRAAQASARTKMVDASTSHYLVAGVGLVHTSVQTEVGAVATVSVQTEVGVAAELLAAESRVAAAVAHATQLEVDLKALPLKLLGHDWPLPPLDLPPPSMRGRGSGQRSGLVLRGRGRGVAIVGAVEDNQSSDVLDDGEYCSPFESGPHS